jgi:hypothetical protein
MAHETNHLSMFTFAAANSYFDNLIVSNDAFPVITIWSNDQPTVRDKCAAIRLFKCFSTRRAA